MENNTEDQFKWEDVLGGNTELMRNSKGILVEMIQERLQAIGYDVPINGIFCAQTEFSVMDLQKNHQLRRTGRVDATTGQLMDRLWENSWDQIKRGYNTLGLGSQCAAISSLQKILTLLALPVEVSGVFGPSTKRRLAAFQERNGLEVNGILDSETAIALEEAAERAQHESAPGPNTTNVSSMVRIGNALVVASVADGLNRMMRAARGDGVVIQVLEGYRDPTRQHTAAREGGFVSTSACTGNPGKNIHGTGYAVDLDDGRSYRWLRRNAMVFGFAMPHVGEPWHWVYQKK